MAGWAVDEPDWRSLLAEQARRSGPLLFRLAYGVLGDREAARDACQDAMLKACKNLQDLKDVRRIGSWLARIVVNESLLLRRRRGIEKRALARHGSTVTATMSATGPIAMETRESVLQALEQLPENLRLVVALRLMEGHSGNEVKDLLGCSAGEVSKQLHEGVELMRNLLFESQKTDKRESDVL